MNGVNVITANPNTTGQHRSGLRSLKNQLERQGRLKILDAFICDIKSRPLVLDEFNEKPRPAVVDRLTVDAEGGMRFLLKNDVEFNA